MLACVSLCEVIMSFLSLYLNTCFRMCQLLGTWKMHILANGFILLTGNKITKSVTVGDNQLRLDDFLYLLYADLPF